MRKVYQISLPFAKGRAVGEVWPNAPKTNLREFLKLPEFKCYSTPRRMQSKLPSSAQDSIKLNITRIVSWEVVGSLEVLTSRLLGAELPQAENWVVRPTEGRWHTPTLQKGRWPQAGTPQTGPIHSARPESGGTTPISSSR